MNANALGHEGFFMARHSMGQSRAGQCLVGTKRNPKRNRSIPQRNRSNCVAMVRALSAGSRLRFSMKTQAGPGMLRERTSELMPELRADLETLVRIPSISHPGPDPSQLGRSAAAREKILGGAGCETKIVEIEGVPAVLGRIEAPGGAPTVLLYAHHDVQPTGARALWHSEPFEPVEKNGRLFGRGTSDDKCGIVMHAGAIRAHDGRTPIGVRVFVEGEEEWGSPNLAKFLDRHGDELRADAVILADAGNWRTGQPGLTISILGIDAPSLTESTNQLVPFARARVSMRIPPGQNADAAMKALAEHLRSHVPWGAEVTVTPRGAGKPYRLAGEGNAYEAMRRAMKEAFGRDPVFVGAGGTIPFVADFAKTFPQATLLLTGAGDPFSNAHSENESLDLKDLERSTLAEALFFEYLAAP